MRRCHRPGIDVVSGTFTDVASLKATLDGIDDIGAMLLVERAPASRRAAGAADRPCGLVAGPRLDPPARHGPPCRPRRHGPPSPVRSFEVRDAGPLDPANLRFFTEDTLQRLLERSGWRVVGRDDLHSSTPSNMTPACATAFPRRWSGRSRPPPRQSIPTGPSPTSYGRSSRARSTWRPARTERRSRLLEPPTAPSINPKASAAVADYLASVGLVVSETNRRALDAKRTGGCSDPPRCRLPKKASPQVHLQLTRPAAAFKRAYARLAP